LEAVENKEALEILETLEVMDASNACEAVQVSARGAYKASQELFKGCSEAVAGSTYYLLQVTTY